MQLPATCSLDLHQRLSSVPDYEKEKEELNVSNI